MLFLLDNGAHSIKFGHDHEPKCFVLFYFWEKQKKFTPHSLSVFQNAVVRSKGDKQTYYGHEIPLCRDRSSLHCGLPFEKVRQIPKT
jgi:hypothetical protein